MSPDKIQQLEYTLMQLGESYRKTALTDIEKSSLYSRIEKNKVDRELMPGKRFSTYTNRFFPSPLFKFSRVSQFGRMGMRVTASVLVVISVLGTSLAAVSAQSLPGQILYDTKIALENFRSELTPNSEARLAYDLSRTTHRFNELQKLNETGTLTPETASLVIKHIEEHAASATEASHALAFAKPKEHKKAFEPLKDTLAKEVQNLAKSIDDPALPSNKIAESALEEVTRIAEETIEEAEKIEITLNEVLSEEIPSEEIHTTPETIPTETITPADTEEAIMPDTALIDNRIEKVITEITPLLSLSTPPIAPAPVEVITPTPAQLPENVNISETPLLETTPTTTLSIATIATESTETSQEKTLTLTQTPDMSDTSTQEVALRSIPIKPIEITTTIEATTPTHTIINESPQKEVVGATFLLEDLRRDYNLLLSAREEKNFDASLKLLEKIETLLANHRKL